jgi:uncharacterized protein (TIGR02246 family)
MYLPKCAIAAGVAGTLAIACGSPATVDLEAEAQAVRERSRQWAAAVAAKDMNAIMDVYAPDAVQMVTNAPSAAGHAAIRSWFESWLMEPGVSNAFSGEKVEVASSGDMAYERGTYRFTMDTAQGPVEDVGKYLTLWKKVDGRWVAAIDIANSDLPAPRS